MTDNPLGQVTRRAAWLPVWRERLVGVLLVLTAVALGFGLFSHLVDGSHQAFGTLARLADGLRPWLLLLSIPLGLSLALAGARWIGGLCVVLALAGLVSLAIDYRSRVAPVGSEADLTVIWFNIFGENGIAPERIEEAIRASGADIIAFAESAPATEALQALSDIYPYGHSCDGVVNCGIQVISRLPITDLRSSDLPSGLNRMLRFTVEHPDAGPVPIHAVHLTKPWYESVRNFEDLRLHNSLRAATSDRQVLIGDFNAAPWSRRIRKLEIARNLSHPRLPTATWPARLGALGVPIDHVFTRGDIAVTRVDPWGEELGSNHRGLRVELDVTGAGD
ncbi:endonuclease/exonuclease/phosphatase family protein [Marinibacterium profundimaris]|uniref:Endonuclease/exonuclease/phosphatase domain-containing protein n=1 Tax=Marinibacterium profundimaris TaxID=1679460 RepID=A0A225NT02_9RHOB|nr:endonuclease/exonuclease/phosphatase family protein [Marinibacterium profundimaris]OWU77963.1 hypothetical protein ATO3_04865 [Marinibacterium profundimaris]